MMTRDRDQRRSPRVQLECPLRYRLIPVNKADFQNGVVQDFSQSGFRFRSRQFVPRRAGFLLEMTVPGHARVRTLARAVWVTERAGEGGYDVGGIFVEPPHDARATLGQLVSGR